MEIPMPNGASTSVSSTNCTSSCPVSSNSCRGLDLLLMAAAKVEGNWVLGSSHKPQMGRVLEEKEQKKKSKKRKVEEEMNGEVERKRRKKRQLAMPTKFQDSVLQPWKRQTRRPNNPNA